MDSNSAERDRLPELLVSRRPSAQVVLYVRRPTPTLPAKLSHLAFWFRFERVIKDVFLH